MSDWKKDFETYRSYQGKRRLPTLQTSARMMAAALVTAAQHAAMAEFTNRDFRTLAGFSGLIQTEQDRIFNELVVATLTVFMLTLEAPDVRFGDDEESKAMRTFFPYVREEIPRAHGRSLADNGVERKYVDIWRKLLTMRYEEYSKDKQEVRWAAMQSETHLTNDTLSDIQVLLPVQTVAIGCHRHICRGKIQGKDELFKHIIRWLGRFYVEYRVLLEGKRITPLMRFRRRTETFLRGLSGFFKKT